MKVTCPPTKLMAIVLVSTLMLVFSIAANATLIEVNSRILKQTFDNEPDLYWYRPVNRFVGFNYTEQSQMISDMPTFELPINRWTFASYTDMLSLVAYGFDVVNPLFPFTEINIEGNASTYGRLSNPSDPVGGDPTHLSYRMVTFRDGTLDGNFAKTLDKSFDAGAFAVARTAPVPEPSTMFLLGTGLIGLAGWGRKKFRK